MLQNGSPVSVGVGTMVSQLILSTAAFAVVAIEDRKVANVLRDFKVVVGDRIPERGMNRLIVGGSSKLLMCEWLC